MNKKRSIQALKKGASLLIAFIVVISNVLIGVNISAQNSTDENTVSKNDQVKEKSEEKTAEESDEGAAERTSDTEKEETDSLTTKTMAQSNVTVEAHDIIISLQEAQTIMYYNILMRADTKVTSGTEGGNKRIVMSVALEDVNKLRNLKVASSNPVKVKLIGEDYFGEIGEKIINVYVYEHVSADKSEAIYADDFIIKATDVNLTNVIAKAGAKAFDINGVPPVELKGMKVSVAPPNKPGMYDVTFTTASGKTSITVKAYVFSTVNTVDKEAINAENFSLRRVLINEQNIMRYAKAKAYNIGTLPAKEVPGLKIISPLPTSIGTHDIIFATPSNKTTIKVKATIVETNVVVEADDIMLSLAEAKKVTGYDILIRSNTRVWTKNEDGQDRIVMGTTRNEVSKLTNLKVAPGQPVEIKITGEDGIGDIGSTIIKVYVYDHVSTDGSEIMYAFDFSIALSDLNAKNLIARAGAKAYKKTVPPEELLGVKITSALPQGLGAHNVTFTSASGKIKITVKAYVFGAVSEDGSEAIDAHDFKIALSDVNAENLIDRAGAKSYDTTTFPGMEYDGLEVTSALPTTAGVYDVVFATASGKTKMTVKAYVFDAISQDETEAINAHDFVIALSDINSQNVIALAEAKTYNIKMLPPTALGGLKITSVLPKAVGVHNVTFASASGKTNITVKAYVYKVVNKTDQEALNATDFAIALKDVTANNLMTRAGLKGYDFKMLPPAALKGLKVKSAIPTTTGTHDITFVSATGKTTITVKAHIYNMVNTAAKEAMNANNFAIALKDINVDNLLSYAKVKTYNITSLPGSETAGARLATPLPMTLGTQDVTFVTASGRTSITVQADVYEVVNPTAQEAMDAHDFTIALKDVSAGNLLTYAEVVAYDITRFPSEELSRVNISSALPKTIGKHEVTFTTPSGKTSITVNAYIHDVVNPRAREAMDADDFVIALKDVNADYFITQAGVKAYNTESLPGIEQKGVHVVSVLPTTTGKHAVSFATASGQTSITVQVEIYDVVNRQENEAMVGQDFAIALKDVNAENFIANAEVAAYDITNLPGKKLASVRVSSQIPTTIGTHAVTFTTPSGKTSITLKAYIYNAVNENAKEAMNAHDFTLALQDVNAENVIRAAGAKAYDIKNLPASESAGGKVASTLPTTIGTHDVTFTTPSGKTSITVKVHIYHVVDPVAEEAMNAHDFALAIDKVNALNFIQAAEVKAFDITSLPGTALTGVQLASALPTTIGVHDVIFKTASGKTTITVRAYIYHVVDPVAEEAMNAHDFALARDDVNAANFIQAAGVQAFDITHLPSIELAGIQLVSVLPTTIGAYRVTFATASGKTQITVKGHIYDVVNEQTKEAMDAQDFAIALDDVTEENFMIHAGVRAYDIRVLPGLAMSGVYLVSALPSASGIHEVTFATASGATSITVKAAVYDTLNNEEHEAMNAHNFSIAKDKISADMLIQLAGAQAYDVTNLPAVVLEGVHVTSALPQSLGTHALTFATASGKTSITVQVSVFDAVSDDRSEGMNAHDFSMTLNNADEANLIEHAGVEAYDITDILSTIPLAVRVVSIVPVNMQEEQTTGERSDDYEIEAHDDQSVIFPVEPGKYNVTFATASGKTTITVEANIFPAPKTIVIDAQDVEFTVQEFKIFIEAKKLEQEILKRANVKVYIQETGDTLTEVSANVTHLQDVEPQHGDIYEVGIHAAVEEKTHMKPIQVHIKADNFISLPITGEDVRTFMFGVMLFVGSLMTLLIINFNKRRKKV